MKQLLCLEDTLKDEVSVLKNLGDNYKDNSNLV